MSRDHLEGLLIGFGLGVFSIAGILWLWAALKFSMKGKL